MVLIADLDVGAVRAVCFREQADALLSSTVARCNVFHTQSLELIYR